MISRVRITLSSKVPSLSHVTRFFFQRAEENFIIHISLAEQPPSSSSDWNDEVDFRHEQGYNLDVDYCSKKGGFIRTAP